MASAERKQNVLSVIVPVFNEEPCLEKLVEQMDMFLAKSTVISNVLFVNDGSTDASMAIIKHVCHKNSNYNYISLSSNSGLSAALKAGIDKSNSPLIGYIDADLQTHPLDFLILLAFIPSYDLVNGVRENRRDTVIKRVSSRVANTYRRKVLRDGILDTCCPLKIAKRAHLKSIPFFNGAHRFLPSLVQLQGGRVKQVPVTHYPRYAGSLSYRRTRDIS